VSVGRRRRAGGRRAGGRARTPASFCNFHGLFETDSRLFAFDRYGQHAILLILFYTSMMITPFATKVDDETQSHSCLFDHGDARNVR